MRPCQNLMDNFHLSVSFFSVIKIGYDDLWINFFFWHKRIFPSTGLDSTLLNCLYQGCSLVQVMFRCQCNQTVKNVSVL